MMNIDTSLFPMNKVDFDQVLEYDEILDALTSNKFNTENILVIPTKNGLDLGLKVRYLNKEGHICHDVRYLLESGGKPFIFIGHDDLYEPHFTENDCLAPIDRQVCDSNQTNWFRHSVKAFPVFIRELDSTRRAVADNSIFEFDPENQDSEYFVKDLPMNYLSPKGMASLIRYIHSNPEDVFDRVCEGFENEELNPDTIIHLNFDELEHKKQSEQGLGE